MKKPTRRDALLATAVNSAEAQTALALENTPMSDVIEALASGQITATALTKGYLARIEAYDRSGPKLNSVRALNADALTIAGKLDQRQAVGQKAAGRRADPGEGQHRNRRQTADYGRFARLGGRAREG